MDEQKPNQDHPVPAGGGAGGALRSTFGFDRTDEGWMSIVRDATSPRAPANLGPYTVLAEIGRGSQGAVFKAVQPRTQRIIAIKRLTAGAFATARAKARFEREVETASALSHPGIVTVLGADTVEGQPVLLLEWVDGEPIDRWALRADPARTIRERLELFAQVCDAVAHAHQRGVLHRDLKPSNILVDREGRPRVLDFGLAKLIGDEAQTSMMSADGILGTPAYAAPEQLGGNGAGGTGGAGMDTRSDVYALGVILYQILTGRLPFDISDDLSALIEAVRHQMPRRPSLLGSALDPELDAIILTALAKEPSHRYQSVDALGADIRRYLSGQVVLAHPPSATYQFSKLVARHRIAFGLAGAAALSLAALAIVSSIMAANLAASLAQTRVSEKTALAARQEAQIQSARNAASAEFLQGLIDSMGQAIAAGQSRPTRTMILDAKARLEAGRLSVDPELEVGLWRRLAQTSFKLNLPIEAGELTAKATQLCEEHLPPDHVELAHCRLLQGLIAEGRDDRPRAEFLYSESARIFTAVLGPDSAETAHALNNRACILKVLLRFDESLECHQKALAIRLKLFGPSHRDVCMSYRNLGALMRAQHKTKEAAEYLQKALDSVATICPPSDSAVLGVRNQLARLARDQGHFDEAERMVREDIATIEHVYGEDSMASIVRLQLLSDIMGRQKRWNEAVELDRRVVSLGERFMPADHPLTAGAAQGLGLDLMHANRFEEAEPALRAAAELLAKCDPPAPTLVIRTNRSLVACLFKLGRIDEAKLLQDSLGLDTDPSPDAPTPP